MPLRRAGTHFTSPLGRGRPRSGRVRGYDPSLVRNPSPGAARRPLPMGEVKDLPMTHPSVHARTQPNKIAYQMAGTGKAITYRELDELSNQGAQLFRSLGLQPGDHIALLLENRLAFMEICWAAQRSGLYYTAISRYLTQDEIAYIIADCGAKVVITTPKCADQIKALIKGAP